MSIQQSFKKNWLKLLIIAVTAIFAIFAFIKISDTIGSQKVFVPSEFFQARSKGAVLADEIVILSKESINNLAEISAEEEISNYTAGLELVLLEVDRNAKSRTKALSLSEELGTMASSLSEVKPENAAEIGLQAIINESQIAQRLINYNNYTLQLLGVLQTRFENGGGSPETDKKVKELIEKMNEEASAINELNENYLKLMSEFDALTQ